MSNRIETLQEAVGDSKIAVCFLLNIKDEKVRCGRVECEGC